MLILKLAFRNIFRQKRRSLLTALTMICGYVLSSASLGLSDGSYSRLIDIFTRERTGHIQVNQKGYLESPSLYKTIPNLGEVANEFVKIPRIRSWTPRVHSSALAFHNNKTIGIQLVGIDIALEKNTTELANKIAKGRFIEGFRSMETAIGPSVAKILKLNIGDNLVAISQAADGSIANDIFKVVGILKGSADAHDRLTAYLPLGTAQQYLSLGNHVHQIVLSLDHQKHARSIAATLQKKLNRYQLEALPWQEVEKEFFQAMQTDKTGNYISLGIILFIVAMGVLNTILMTILERTREFGVLNALGTRPTVLIGMIMLESTILAMMSVGAGIVIALGLHSYLVRWGIALPEPVTFEGFEFSVMLSEVTFNTIALPAIVTIITAVMVSLLPALRAAKIAPTKALRNI